MDVCVFHEETQSNIKDLQTRVSKLELSDAQKNIQFDNLSKSIDDFKIDLKSDIACIRKILDNERQKPADRYAALTTAAITTILVFIVQYLMKLILGT
ncbi:hypothetical protein A7K50_03260 [Dehalobacter sp. MCB1]|uniref:hypothetical protein n=1 Tax=Dehalobacter sp. MCB1 TaxID=1844756 RepID=UPI0003A7D846|nr:hypothetical protein [Dehalobacter sp. MCB1]RJE47680.1 hypothetical protein A7K50_03260 [Dehalobacter sp. MCB1]